MKTLSLKLDDAVFDETEKVLEQMKISRNRYINEALDFFNKVQKRKLLAETLAAESKLVGVDSMEVLKEFDQLEENEW
ncbi:hypothetical protein [Algoriphagus taiwanensis]|uniref:CopG family transcriptional regulator n=1 Tax=Algoriphagus taiwanensis TaxID=1445656 RepID=A0ABQ6Q446_9BACT|nr:hypothetical protein Ataiwa_31210 [Algoriphagus taiwanensis]